MQFSGFKLTSAFGVFAIMAVQASWVSAAYASSTRLADRTAILTPPICGEVYALSTTHDDLLEAGKILKQQGVFTVGNHDESPFYAVTGSANLSWILFRYQTEDGDSLVLQVPSANAKSRLPNTLLRSSPRAPRSKLGFSLGNQMSRIATRYGARKIGVSCGQPTLSFAWPLNKYVDGYVEYFGDSKGRVRSIVAGSAQGGLSHLWQKSPIK